MKRFRIVLVILFAIVLTLFVHPYPKAAAMTALHGNEFVGLEQETRMLNESRYLRVLNYSDSVATVFYVSDTGAKITFVSEADGWRIVSWEVIYSTTGSADGFIWPYYR